MAPADQLLPLAATRRARLCLLARALWPFPRYLNSVLFLPAGQLPGPA